MVTMTTSNRTKSFWTTWLSSFHVRMRGCVFGLDKLKSNFLRSQACSYRTISKWKVDSIWRNRSSWATQRSNFHFISVYWVPHGLWKDPRWVACSARPRIRGQPSWAMMGETIWKPKRTSSSQSDSSGCSAPTWPDLVFLDIIHIWFHPESTHQVEYMFWLSWCGTSVDNLMTLKRCHFQESLL